MSAISCHAGLLSLPSFVPASRRQSSAAHQIGRFAVLGPSRLSIVARLARSWCEVTGPALDGNVWRERARLPRRGDGGNLSSPPRPVQSVRLRYRYMCMSTASQPSANCCLEPAHSEMRPFGRRRAHAGHLSPYLSAYSFHSLAVPRSSQPILPTNHIRHRNAQHAEYMAWQRFLCEISVSLSPPPPSPHRHNDGPFCRLVSQSNLVRYSMLAPIQPFSYRVRISCWFLLPQSAVPDRARPSGCRPYGPYQTVESPAMSDVWCAARSRKIGPVRLWKLLSYLTQSLKDRTRDRDRWNPDGRGLGGRPNSVLILRSPRLLSIDIFSTYRLELCSRPPSQISTYTMCSLLARVGLWVGRRLRQRDRQVATVTRSGSPRASRPSAGVGVSQLKGYSVLRITDSIERPHAAPHLLHTVCTP